MSLSVENKFIILDKTSTIKVEGDDRVQFLQGQLTQDINLISQNKALYAGFCNSKGRMLAFMLCYLNHESIHIQIDSSIQEFILQKLKMYILRSKVSLKLANETFLCIGFVGSKALLTKNIQPPKNYLDIKGCYTGQEIVARTHYLGKVKRRMYRAFLKSRADLIPGDLILNNKGEEIGQLVRAANENNEKTNMLIELRVDQAHEALFINSQLIEIFLEDQKRFD